MRNAGIKTNRIKTDKQKNSNVVVKKKNTKLESRQSFSIIACSNGYNHETILVIF